MTVAEGTLIVIIVSMIGLLQWGRNLTVAEGTTTIGGVPKSLNFNGAAT